MEVSGKKLSDQDHTYCQPCCEEGENILADAFCTICKEFLCSTCENEHRILKATKRHTLMDMSYMPTSMTDEIYQEDNNVPCEIHPKEFIKYFCPAHETVNCGHCLAFEHRSCKINLVSDISDSFKTSQDYGDIKNSIARLLKCVNDCVRDIKSNIKMVLKIGEDEVKKLIEYRENVNNYFDEREKSLLEIIEQVKDMDKTRLESLKPKCDSIKAQLDKMKCKLDEQERNSVNLFIEAKKVRKQIECLEAALNDISKENKVQRYEFLKHTATENLIAASSGLGIVRKDQTLAASSGLGKVSKGQKTGKQTVPIDLTSLWFTAAQGIPVSDPNDTKECRMTCMLLLPESMMLLADYNNSTVHLVDLHTFSMISQVKLAGKSWGMCVLPGYRVAVCLHDKSSVVFLDARGRLSEATSIELYRKCYDIVYHTEQLVVSFERGRIVKMDMKGNTIKQIDNDNGQALFRSCLNMTLMGDGQKAAILVSDFYKHTITKLDIDLNMLQTFKDPAMQNATGLTVVGNKLLICSYGTHKILRLDLSSGKIIELLGESDGIQHPYRAVYSTEQNKLYITSYISGKNDVDNNVHVYKVK
ncbi:uncharacterized protein LOC128236497 [Mya arenaria]|uniref:uncharacterized protein LOC128236497 n=1 Tax=Mya arenaria TaxID=6604 RepID=UPI0022E923B2|nr:uncharacterized protein LOC128236497 [Mya arenaria]XP_052807343.1 uncharacterized protein LOC128236497 [Mya arenaria]